MQQIVRYTLGKDERLKSRKAIDQLFNEGRSFSIFPFRVLYIFKQGQVSLDSSSASNHCCSLQAGFTVSSRHFKKAVDRNRVKRLMRETYRLQKNELQMLPELNKNMLTIFFVYVGKELPEYKLVFEEMGTCLKKIIKLTRDNR